MEEHFFEKIPGLENLLESKDFEALTNPEKKKLFFT